MCSGSTASASAPGAASGCTAEGGALDAAEGAAFDAAKCGTLGGSVELPATHEPAPLFAAPSGVCGEATRPGERVTVSLKYGTFSSTL